MKLLVKLILAGGLLVLANRGTFYGFNLMNQSSDSLALLGIITVLVSILVPLWCIVRLVHHKEKHTHESQSNNPSGTGGAGTF